MRRGPRPKLTVREALILLESENIELRLDGYEYANNPDDYVSGEALNLMSVLNDKILRRQVNGLSADFETKRIAVWIEDEEQSDEVD